MRNFLYPEEASQILRLAENKRDLMYFATALYLGTRHNETASVRWKDLIELEGPRKEFKLYTSKQKKYRIVKMQEEYREIVKKCWGYKELTELVAPSRWSASTAWDKMTDQGGRNLCAKYFDLAGVPDNVQRGTHVLRRTFGRSFYINNGKSHDALLYLSRYFRHSNIDTTCVYIGLTSDVLGDMTSRVTYEITANQTELNYLERTSLKKFLEDCPELINLLEKTKPEYDWRFLR